MNRETKNIPFTFCLDEILFPLKVKTATNNYQNVPICNRPTVSLSLFTEIESTNSFSDAHQYKEKTWYSRLNIDACTQFCVQFFALFSKWRWRILCNAILLRNGTMQMQLFLAQICLFCYFVSFSRSFKQTLTFLFYCESQIQIGSIQKFLHFDRNSFPRTLELTTHT